MKPVSEINKNIFFCFSAKENKTISYCNKNPNACLNGGSCIDLPGEGNFTCTCPPLFSGARCDYLATDFGTEKQLAAASRQSSSTRPLPQIRFTSPTPPSSRPTLSSMLSPTTSAPDKYEDNNLEETTNFPLIDKEPKTTPKPSLKLPSTIDAAIKARWRQLNKQNRFNNQKHPKFRAGNTDINAKLQYKFIEREQLPLPIFLPRVSDIIPGESTSVKRERKEPKPILILETPTILSPRDNDTDEQDQRLNMVENIRFVRNDMTSKIPSQEDKKENLNSSSEFEKDSISRISSIRSRPILDIGDISTLSKTEMSNFEQTFPTQTILSRRIGIPFEDIPSQVSLHQQNPLIHSIQAIPHVSLTKDIGKPKISSLDVEKDVWVIENDEKNSKNHFVEKNLGPGEMVVGAESETKTYYEENRAGRVHIGDVSGVDRHAPYQEIFDAYIDLRKL